MAASRVSRCLMNQVWMNCMKARSRHAILLQRYPQSTGYSQGVRSLSTSKCLCEDNKDDSSGEIKSDLGQSGQDKTGLDKDKNTESLKVQPKTLSEVIQDIKKTEELKQASGSSSLDESSTSSSESDSDSSSDSDAQTNVKVDVALDKAAEDVAEILPGNKEKTKAELKAAVLEKLKIPARPPPGKGPAKAPAQERKLRPLDFIKPIAKTNGKQTKQINKPDIVKERETVKKDITQSVKTKEQVVEKMVLSGDQQQKSTPPKRQKSTPPKQAKSKPAVTEEELKEQEEKKRATIEKMKMMSARVSQKLMDAEEAEERQGQRKEMYDQIDRRRRFSQDEGRYAPGDRPREGRFPRDQRPPREDRFPRGPQESKVMRDRRTMEDREEPLDTPGQEEKPVISAFDGKPLGIFKPQQEAAEAQSSGKRYLSDILAEERRAEMYEYPARNAWEEQIQWTRQGKLWTFPIDNEAGWEEEKNVPFQDHVFLERQLRDFPQRGPIRHFMELVTVALSKNPHMSVREKHEHIDWFRTYFREKENVLTGPLGDMAKFKEAPGTEKTS